MKNPETKYWKIISGQEVNLSPKGIVVQCCDGAVKIEVLKNGIVNFYAQDEIQIAVKGEINVEAKRMVKMVGEKTVQVGSVKGGRVILDKKGNITVTGVEVRMN